MHDPKTQAAQPAPGPRHQALTTFIALLEHEQQALGNPQVEALEAIAAAKQVLVNELHVLCGGSHFSSSAAGSTNTAEQEVPALARRAQRLNAINATMLAMHRTACESRLRVLRGGDHGTTLYRANGYLGL